MMIQPAFKSYYYALPNKFFESIQALTPILASDFPEMKRLIDKYQIGLTCCPTDPKTVSERIARMRDDEDFRKRCRENLVKAKQELCWENEKHILMDAFMNVTKGMP